MAPCTPQQKTVVSFLSSILTDIRTLHSRLNGNAPFHPTIEFVFDPNYLDADYRAMVSLGHTAKFTAPYTLIQLAKMERQWATLLESATAMMQHDNCPSNYWGLAMRKTFYVRNCLPTREPASFHMPSSSVSPPTSPISKYYEIPMVGMIMDTSVRCTPGESWP
jgi:hypothetical protein